MPRFHVPPGYRLNHVALASRAFLWFVGFSLLALPMIYGLAHAYIYGKTSMDGVAVNWIDEEPILLQTLRFGIGDGSHTPFGSYERASSSVFLPAWPLFLCAFIGVATAIWRPNVVSAAVGYAGFATTGFMWSSLAKEGEFGPGATDAFLASMWTWGVVLVVATLVSRILAWRPLYLEPLPATQERLEAEAREASRRERAAAVVARHRYYKPPAYRPQRVAARRTLVGTVSFEEGSRVVAWHTR